MILDAPALVARPSELTIEPGTTVTSLVTGASGGPRAAEVGVQPPEVGCSSCIRPVDSA
jgi:hypothetical protein